MSAQRTLGGLLTWAALAVVASALLLSGCGGSGDDESEKSGSATTTASEPSASSSEDKFTNDNWAELASNPDEHKGAEVDFIGQVFTTPERDKDGVYLQVYADPKNSEHNTIVAYAQPDFVVAQDDFVHITGTAEGKYEGENAFGATITVPTVKAEMKVVDVLAAAPPAIATLPPRSTTKAKITVTVRRVEFAATETRVLLKATNKSGRDVDVYDSSMKAVQAGRQYESEYSGDYEELSSELVPGASTSGVVVFPKMNPNAGLKLIVEVESGNYDIGDFGTLRYMFVWA